MAFKEGISILFGALHGDSPPPPHLLLVPGVLFEDGEGVPPQNPVSQKRTQGGVKTLSTHPPPFPVPSFPDFRSATPI